MHRNSKERLVRQRTLRPSRTIHAAAADSIRVNEATKAAQLYRQSLTEQVRDGEMCTERNLSFCHVLLKTLLGSSCEQFLSLQELGQKSHRRTNSRFSMLKRQDLSQRSHKTAAIHQQVTV